MSDGKDTPKYLYWVNDHPVNPNAIDCLKSALGDDWKIVVSKVNYQRANLQEAASQLIAECDSTSVFVLTDGFICQQKEGGFELLKTMADKSKLERGMVVSSDLHPSPSDQRWNTRNRSSMWWARAESTNPSIGHCRFIARYFKEGTVSFHVDALKMLRRMEAALTFVPLNSDVQRQFLENWRKCGGTIGSDSEMLAPFAPEHALLSPENAKTWAVFPDSLEILKKTCGIKISRTQLEEGVFQAELDNWRKCFHPFESLRLAASLDLKAYQARELGSSGAISMGGGAVRFLWEFAVARPSADSALRFSTEVQEKLDSVQQDWIREQYRLLHNRFEAVKPEELSICLTIAAKEIEQGITFMTMINREGGQ